MTDALDAGQRTRLERLVTRARHMLEDDLGDQAAGRFGIDPDGTIADEAALRLDATALTQRSEIVDVVDHLRSEGDVAATAVARLLREVAFTHLNRLVAIRIAEALGLLPPSLANGRSSQGFRDLLELAPLLAADDTGGYWTYLRLCGDELAGDIPNLFDPRNPLLALAPSPGALDTLVDLLSDPDASALWLAPDCLGWVYQFFNTGDERRAMREGSAAPRDSRELAVRNQFFTPRYVVDFLVQNSLGRRLMDADPASPLLDDLPLLIDPPTDRGEPVDLDDVSMLDPACGSGHFLLAGYDVLERAWHHAGVKAAEAAPAIVRSLWGIDIDPRCAQVASAAVIFRARRSCPEGVLPRPNIVCARALPATSTGLDEVLAALPDEHRRLVVGITEAMADAPILGSLLKIEERLASEIRGAAFGGAAPCGSLAEALPEETLQTLEDGLLAGLASVANATSATPAERLMAAETDDAIRFVHAMQRRYDTVLMNPPYGAAAEGTTSYLQSSYPNSWTEMYACFVERSLELCKRHGRVGALTSSQFLSTKRLQSLRELLESQAHLAALVDLGAGVLDGATVNTAMYIIENRRTSGMTYYSDLVRFAFEDRARLAQDPRRPAGLRDLSAFRCVPGSPFAFHLPEAVVDLWRRPHRLEPHLATVRTGCKSFDDVRFVRAHWEVGPTGITAGWRRYLKGGEYQPYYAPSHLVLNWKQEGRELREEGTRVGRLAQVMQSSSHWGTAGICYPRMSSIGFAARVMQPDEVFADQSIAVLPNTGVDVTSLLGLLNATGTAELLQTFGRGRATENGAMKALPFGRELLTDLIGTSPLVEELITIFADKERTEETSSVFVRPECLHSPEEVTRIRTDLLSRAGEAQERLDGLVLQALGTSGRLDPELPSRTSLLGRSLRSPSAAHDDWARDLVSYLVGVGFGRWNPELATVELARDAEYLAPIPRVPPGMLTTETGDPAWEHPTRAPRPIPPSGVLLDEPGHRLDIEAVLREVVKTVPAGTDALERSLKVLRCSSARDYLRGRFFQDHLAKYTRSRRRAPIYWPLYVPSGRWGAWVHASALSRESLFAVASAASDRASAAEIEGKRLQRERDTGGAGRSPRDVVGALEAEESLAGELRRFRDEADRIAGLGWEPDLDDGIILCAAPLAGLFPAWKDADSARKEIKAGKYPWATVAQWADQL